MWNFRIFIQILCEINFGESRISKSTVYAILGALNFVNLVKNQPPNSAKINENEKSEPLYLLEW